VTGSIAGWANAIAAGNTMEKTAVRICSFVFMMIFFSSTALAENPQNASKFFLNFFGGDT
jgi:hypothetical protein